MKLFSRYRCKLLLIFIGLVDLGGCHNQHAIKFAGEAQGTTYHITVIDKNRSLSAAVLQHSIDQRLIEIDKALSNYREDSELSRFNRAPVGKWIDLSRDLYAVLTVSNMISRESEGAFDITVAPLVDVWGFGPKKYGGPKKYIDPKKYIGSKKYFGFGKNDETIPTAVDIRDALAKVDYRALELDTAAPRAKKNQALSIDVNGIAQGYSVDQLAEVLFAQGCSDFLVEVGGELRLAGRNLEGDLWRVGIEQPNDNIVQARQALSATSVGVTTAGDYHDYFEKDGVRYSHTIDPHSGRPIAHKLASVTVVAPTAVLADGYDTALEVMGPDKGFDFAQRMHIAAYFIVRGENGFSVRRTSAMAAYFVVRPH